MLVKAALGGLRSVLVIGCYDSFIPILAKTQKICLQLDGLVQERRNSTWLGLCLAGQVNVKSGISDWNDQQTQMQ